MSRHTLSFAVVTFTALLLAGCAGSATPSPTPSAPPTATVAPTLAATRAPTAGPTPFSTATRIPSGLLRINIGAYPDIIDPQKSSFANEIATLHLIYEGLTRIDNDLNTVPGAADRWEYSADAMVLTFHIREGLAYSDGTPLNAKRFEYSLLRNIDPETAGEYAAITDDIVGAAEWLHADTTGEGYDAAKYKAAVGIHALDDAGRLCADGANGYAQYSCRTLRIALRHPAPYFHSVMSMWVTYPAKEENILAGGQQWWNSALYLTGNGPFIVSIVEPFVRQYLIPNPRYWRGQATYDVEYSYITDPAAAFGAYRNGDLDIVTYGAEDLPQINADPQLRSEALLYPGSCTYSLMFNLTKEPFTDRKVREAFAFSIDRDAWARDVLGGFGVPTLTWIPPGFPGHDPTEARYAFDPESARAALAESSYGSAGGVPEIKWFYCDTPRSRTRAEWLIAQFEAVLGVAITPDPFDGTSCGHPPLHPDHATTPAVLVRHWCVDYPDPHAWLSATWHSDDPEDRPGHSYLALLTGYSNPDLDALLDRADSAVDATLRLSLYAQAEDVLLDDVPMVPMWNSANACLVKPWVKGLVTTSMDTNSREPYAPGWCGSNDPLTIRIER